MQTLELVRNINPSLTIGGVILTMYATRTKLSQNVVNEVRNFFKDIVFETIIPRNVRLSEAPSYGQTIFQYDPKSVGAQSYGKLADEFIKRFNT